MALINLDTGIDYDTEKKFIDQSEEATDWLYEFLFDKQFRTVTDDELCGLDLESNEVRRPCCEVYSNLGYELTVHTSYQESKTHRRCFAFSSQTYELKEI